MTASAARAGIGRYLDLYNRRRPHSSLDDQTPDQAYFGRASLLPIRSAAVLVRQEDDLARAHAAVAAAGREPVSFADSTAAIIQGDSRVSAGLLEQAKGFEFKAVAVMACDATALPLEANILAAADDTERDEAISAERRLLYVGCTRAREHLFVSGVSPVSPFLKLFDNLSKDPVSLR